jgi:hypothetical protein
LQVTDSAAEKRLTAWTPLRLIFGISGLNEKRIIDVISQFKNEFQPSHFQNDEYTNLVFNAIHANNICQLQGEQMHFQFEITSFEKESHSFPDKYEHLDYSKNPVNAFRGISSQSQVLPYFVEKSINGRTVWEDQLVLDKRVGREKHRYHTKPCPLPSGWDRGRVHMQVYVNHNTKTVSYSHPLNVKQVKFEKVECQRENRYEYTDTLSHGMQRLDLETVTPNETPMEKRSFHDVQRRFEQQVSCDALPLITSFNITSKNY